MTTMTMLERLQHEGREIIQEARDRSLKAKLLGGMAIRLLLDGRLHPGFERPIRDLDLLTRRRHVNALEALITARGWKPHRSFNALNGARRMLFEDPQSVAQVDVFVESFEMCHRLPLADRLDTPGDTLDATDLFMTKLQIVQLNAKDRADLYALLHGCDPEGDAERAIQAERIAELTARDWGLHHTFELNLAHLRAALGETPLDPKEAQEVLRRIDALDAAMQAAEKSRPWKLRARIGERKRWYEEPEEVHRPG